MRHKKILEFDQLKHLREELPDLRLVHCHGVFDVLHAGHLAYFQTAKKFGDRLVVTITADKFVNKGPGRPYFNNTVRAEMVAALEVVDYVAVNNHPTAVPVIEALRPHFYVKGPDYKDKAADVTGAIFDEEKAAELGGGKLVFTEDETFSSSLLINRFFNCWTEDQQRVIDTVKSAGGLALIEKVLNDIAELKVSVIGEPIVDEYVFCTPENISSKSPSISAKYLYKELYAGGSLAIANHLADFVKEVRLYITHGSEEYFSKLLKERLDSRVVLFAQQLDGIPTPRKTRFIVPEGAQRIFEITDLRSDQWMYHSPKEFCELIVKHNDAESSTIVADFGHGFFEGELLETVQNIQGYVGLNVQTNSSNFGFNTFKKHRKFSYLSIDTKEVRIAYQDRLTPPLELAKKLHGEVSTFGASSAITLGSAGAYYFSPEHREGFYSPALADNVVDATGAGDSFFSITSLLVKVGCPPVVIPFIGNVFAGLKTKIMGNKSSVTRAQFLKAVSSILK